MGILARKLFQSKEKPATFPEQLRSPTSCEAELLGFLRWTEMVYL